MTLRGSMMARSTRQSHRRLLARVLLPSEVYFSARFLIAALAASLP
jgi:hypothetical protein